MRRPAAASGAAGVEDPPADQERSGAFWRVAAVMNFYLLPPFVLVRAGSLGQSASRAPSGPKTTPATASSPGII